LKTIKTKYAPGNGRNLHGNRLFLCLKMQYARITPRKPRYGLFLFRYSFIPPRARKRRTSENRRRVFTPGRKKGRAGTFWVRFRGAMRKQPSFSRLDHKGHFTRKKTEENGNCRNMPKIAYQEGGVTVKRTPGRRNGSRRRGAFFNVKV